MSRFPECWVVERDEYNEPFGVSGYSEVADLGEIKLCYVMLVDGEYPEKEELFEEWVQEQKEEYSTEFYVFPSADCYKTREEAKKALERVNEDAEQSCYSFDGVYYGELYETEEECKKVALQELLSMNTFKEVYIGKVCTTGFTPEIDIDNVLYNIIDTAEANEGESAEDYLHDIYYAKEGSENYKLQVELSERLNKVLLDFLKENDLMPDWYIVEEWELYRLVDGELVQIDSN